MSEMNTGFLSDFLFGATLTGSAQQMTASFSGGSIFGAELQTGSEELAASVMCDSVVKADFIETVNVDTRYETYDGPYQVVPTSLDQTLQTRQKVMSGNVLVEQVPYSEVGNEYGGNTVTIL